jgi:hypothetical protein
MFDAETYQLTKQWKPVSTPFAQPIVGLEFVGGMLCTCTVSGSIIVRDLESGGSEHSYWLSVSIP